jgi:hypothetical protein
VRCCPSSRASTAGCRPVRSRCWATEHRPHARRRSVLGGTSPARWRCVSRGWSCLTLVAALPSWAGASASLPPRWPPGIRRGPAAADFARRRCPCRSRRLAADHPPTSPISSPAAWAHHAAHACRPARRLRGFLRVGRQTATSSADPGHTRHRGPRGALRAGAAKRIPRSCCHSGGAGTSAGQAADDVSRRSGRWSPVPSARTRDDRSGRTSRGGERGLCHYRAGNQS